MAHLPSYRICKPSTEIEGKKISSENYHLFAAELCPGQWKGLSKAFHFKSLILKWLYYWLYLCETWTRHCSTWVTPCSRWVSCGLWPASWPPCCCLLAAPTVVKKSHAITISVTPYLFILICIIRSHDSRVLLQPSLYFPPSLPSFQKCAKV